MLKFLSLVQDLLSETWLSKKTKLNEPKLSDFNADRKTNILDSGFRRNDGRDLTGFRHAGLDPASSRL